MSGRTHSSTSRPVSLYSSPTCAVMTVSCSNGHGLRDASDIHRTRIAVDYTPIPYDRITKFMLFPSRLIRRRWVLNSCFWHARELAPSVSAFQEPVACTWDTVG